MERPELEMEPGLLLELDLTMVREMETETETETKLTMGPPRSLFVVVYFDGANTDMGRYISILQLNKNKGYSVPRMPGQCQEATLNQHAYVARFNEPRECPEIRWFFSPPTSSSTLDLYMVPNFVGLKVIGAPLHGCKFNFRDRTCQPIKPPAASKIYPHAVTCGGRIYFMADPDRYYTTPDPVFECYDPDGNEWKALEPYPDHDVYLLCGTIEASAVWEDTILYNMGSCRIWAYNVPRDWWYVVNIEDDRCCTIVGEAIVLGNTIYALTTLSRDLVLALSITVEFSDGEPVFTCSLCSEISVPGMGDIAYEDEDKAEDSYSRKRRLVHSYEHNFLLVQSCKHLGSPTKQPIQVTYLKLIRADSLTVTNVCIYWVEIPHGDQFEVQLCFSLPECKTTALNEGDGVEPGFSLDIGYYASKQEAKTDFDPEPFLEFKNVTMPKNEYLPVLEYENVTMPEYENVTLPEDEEGHSVIVRNLPLYVALGELRKLLVNFGPVKDGIRLRSNKREKRCYAFVEFKSAKSMQRAIEESSSKKGVMINGCRVIIKEKRSTELTRVDSSRTRAGSTSAWGKVSPSKMTSGGQDLNAAWFYGYISGSDAGSSACSGSGSGSKLAVP